MSEGDRSLQELTAEMTGWQSSTVPELMLDYEQTEKFLERVALAHDELDAQLVGANGLKAWISNLYVGKFDSANATRDHLAADIDEFIKVVAQYQQYLHAVQQTTDAARRSFGRADQPS